MSNFINTDDMLTMYNSSLVTRLHIIKKTN